MSAAKTAVSTMKTMVVDFFVFVCSMHPSYIANTCLPIVTTVCLENIHLLVAVVGL